MHWPAGITAHTLTEYCDRVSSGRQLLTKIALFDICLKEPSTVRIENYEKDLLLLARR